MIMKPAINHRKIIHGSVITLADKKQVNITYQFKELESDMTLLEAEVLLKEIINEWEKLAKRFSLQGDEDRVVIYRSMFYADQITKKFPSLKMKYLYNHYDETLDEYLGKKYVVRQDKKAQEQLGYLGVIIDGKSLYLFPLK